MPEFTTHPSAAVIASIIQAWIIRHGGEDLGWGRTPAGQISVINTIHALAEHIADADVKKTIQTVAGKAIGAAAAKMHG